MLGISKTLDTAGMTPKMFQGAADIYRFIAGTSLGKETPEKCDKTRDGKDVVRLSIMSAATWCAWPGVKPLARR
jgi:hypothetical protein